VIRPVSAEAVRAFFVSGENQGAIAARLRASTLSLEDAESVSVSPHSPQPVQDEETLARLLHSPHFVDADTGTPTPAALKDAESRGLSVDRVEIAGEAGIHERGAAKERADNERKKGVNPVRYVGFIRVNCGAVRALRDEGGQRQFFVFDTATEQNRAHADVCHGRFRDEKEKRLARAALMDQFQPLVRPPH
jgi:hypothetical protein